MLKNYIRTAYRNMMRNFSQSLFTILGLSIGMTCTLLIFLWVQNQLNYDQSQEKKDRIFRLEADWVILPPYIGDLITQFPEVENMTRFYMWLTPTLNYEDKSIVLNNFAAVDSSIFNTFNFDFIHGNPEHAFEKPFSIVLTKSESEKLFGDENPVGKVAYVDNTSPYTVTAVVDDIKNMHLEINAFIALQDAAKASGDNSFLESRDYNFFTYILLKQGVNKNAFEAKMKSSNFDETDDEIESELLLRPFNEIYFTRGLQHERFVKHGNYNLVLIFSTISILILIIACINFINITTAKTQQRIKEIGIRKIVGATRKKLIYQFIGETLIFVIISHIISIVILELILSDFNSIIEEFIEFKYFSSFFIITTISIMVVTTILAGFYPALYLSSVKPVLMLKGKSGNSSKKGGLRKILMTFQFSISIFLIISTLVIVKQLNFVLNKDLGWNKENIVVFKLRGDNFSGRENTENSKDALKNELLSNPDIINITYLNQLPGTISNTWGFEFKGEKKPLKVINSDLEFIKLMGLKLVQGRNFSFDFDSDNRKKIILNEAAVKYFEIENPIGAVFSNNNVEIIGVVKDFNFNSLHNKIEPVGITWSYWASVACVKVGKNNITNSIKHIEEAYQKFCPNYPFEYTFMDDTFAKQYKQEIKLSKILVFFALIAIFIASLGLYGMSAFMAISRKKEIGIRKALGSSTTDIMYLFSSGFVKWIFISFLISSPIAYYTLKKWLMQYPYQTNISWWVFVLALALSLLISLITIGFQVIKSSRINPVECLRYE